MLKFIGEVEVARWFLGLIAVLLGAGVVYWAGRRLAGGRDVAG